MNDNKKICFVISPMGDEGSSTRDRADYVLETYIEPACARRGYKALRADHDDVNDLARGITSAVQNAPMVISYLGAPACGNEGCRGAPFWNANVMIETGSRVASRLPLVLLCDRDPSGHLPRLPFTIQSWNAILLPGPVGGPTPKDWTDPNPEPTIEKIEKRLEAERKSVRLLNCRHPLASISASNRHSSAPESLLYTAASPAAEQLFGIKADDDPQGRLVGRNMAEFLKGVRDRMHPVQWKMFHLDQKRVRDQLSSGNLSAVARIPIVLEPPDGHGTSRQAYLPVIVQYFQRDRDGENDWYSLRVLYLDVTAVTEKLALPNGDEYYACNLNPMGGDTLVPLKKFAGVRVFVSYTRAEASVAAEELLTALKGLVPHVDPFIDISIPPGTPDIKELKTQMDQAEIFFLLLSSKPRGPGQKKEIDYLNGKIMEDKAPVIVPVMIDDSRDTGLMENYEWIKASELTDGRLKAILLRNFRDRCADEWAEEVPVLAV